MAGKFGKLTLFFSLVSSLPPMFIPIFLSSQFLSHTPTHVSLFILILVFSFSHSHLFPFFFSSQFHSYPRLSPYFCFLNLKFSLSLSLSLSYTHTPTLFFHLSLPISLTHINLPIFSYLNLSLSLSLSLSLFSFLFFFFILVSHFLSLTSISLFFPISLSYLCLSQNSNLSTNYKIYISNFHISLISTYYKFSL